MKLFHVSEEKNIAKFVPRYSTHTNEPVVWAISENKIANYLLPRNCPRIAFCAGKNTSFADRQYFLSSSQQVIAIEALWYEQVTKTKLYLYEMPSSVFSLFDAIAGYHVTNSIVVPLSQQTVDCPIQKLLTKNIELRLLPSLWDLHDLIANSTLEFSIIRMKNAQPRPLKKPLVEVYGIPNCGTCKKAIKWLQDNNVNYQFINTKDNPPSTTMIENWIRILGNKAMRNTSGKSYRDLGDEKKTWTDQQWIKAFAADAMLLKRPLFVKDNQAVLVGFRASEVEIKDRLGVS